jgi:hypothetical protein
MADMTSRCKGLLVIVVLLSGFAIRPAAADAARDFVLAAFTAEEQAPAKRAVLTYRRGTAVSVYRIERVMPDRLHLQLSDRNGDQEIYIIARRLYAKGPAGWTVSAAAPQLASPVSVIGLFADRLEDLVELAPSMRDGVAHRVFEGKISWYSGRHNNEGKIQFMIDNIAGLPRLMKFDGTCGSDLCSFEQLMTYEPSLTIEAPIQ